MVRRIFETCDMILAESIAQCSVLVHTEMNVTQMYKETHSVRSYQPPKYSSAVTSCNRPVSCYTTSSQLTATSHPQSPVLIPRRKLPICNTHYTATRTARCRHTHQDSLSLKLMTYGFVMKNRGCLTCCLLNVNNV